MAIILGIDPGSRITGFAIINFDGRNYHYIDSGQIYSSNAELAQRLYAIFNGIESIVQKFKPNNVAIENIFTSINSASALKLGQARGSAIAAVAKFAIPVAEYAPRLVKQAVTGYGAAQKSQVRQMVMSLLNLQKKPSLDEADALAIAICHCNYFNQQIPVKKKISNRNKWSQKFKDS